MDRNASIDAKLSAFNRQMLERQEEAYTLAYYLLGSSEQAAQAVQEALLRSFGQPANRLRFLRAVIAGCQQINAAALPNPTGPAEAHLLSLPPAERKAILLVDVLGLSYVEAAQVLGTTTSRLSQQLAHGRVLSLHAQPIQRTVSI